MGLPGMCQCGIKVDSDGARGRWKEASTFFALVVFERLEASEGGAAGNHFMAEGGLVFFEVLALVDLLVVVFVLVYGRGG
jgi:hypothetical protein